MIFSDEEVTRDLQAPFKSFRLLAVERILTGAKVEQFRAVLKEVLATEEDPECRFLIAYALQSNEVSSAEKPEETKSVLPSSPKEFRNHFVSLDLTGKLSFLRNIKRPQKKQFAGESEIFFREELNPVILAHLVKAFGNFWTSDFLGTLISDLSDRPTGVCFALLEVLSDRIPEQLVPHLPPLLISDDPLLRAMAIQSLAKIDLPEAVKHLEHMLLEGEPMERQAGLQIAFHLPYEEVKDALLKYLYVEKDLILLQKGGLHFRINPDPNIPFRLWELLESSTGEKAKLLKEIVAGATQALRTSQMLQNDFADYKKRLETWIKERAATRLVRNSIAKMNQSSREELEELLDLLRKKIGQSQDLRKAYEDALLWPITDDTRTLLRRLLSPDMSPVPVTNEPAKPGPKPTALQDLPPDRLISLLGKWPEEKREELEKLLPKIFESKKDSSQVLTAVFRTAFRLEIPSLQSLAEKMLASDEKGLVAASLEYLGRFDRDKILPFIGRFLGDPDPRIPVVALKILQEHDTPQAISSMMALLRKSTPANQKGMIDALMNFDFSLMRDPIVEMFENEKDAKLLSPILCLFESNPDPKNIESLLRLEKCFSGDSWQLIKDTRKKCERTLLSYQLLTNVDLQKIENDFLEKWKREQKKAAAPPPAYSLKVTQTSHVAKKKMKTLATEETGKKDGESDFFIFLNGLVSSFIQYWWVWGTISGLVLLIFFATLLFSTGGSKKARLPELEKQIFVKGRVLSTDEKSKTFRFGAGRNVFILPLDALPSHLRKKGSTLEYQLVPKSYTSDDEIKAGVDLIVY